MRKREKLCVRTWGQIRKNFSVLFTCIFLHENEITENATGEKRCERRIDNEIKHYNKSYLQFLIYKQPTETKQQLCAEVCTTCTCEYAVKKRKEGQNSQRARATKSGSKWQDTETIYKEIYRKAFACDV